MDFTGRPMKGFVFVEAGGLATDRQLRGRVSMAREFAQILPRKNRQQIATATFDHSAHESDRRA